MKFWVVNVNVNVNVNAPINLSLKLNIYRHRLSWVTVSQDNRPTHTLNIVEKYPVM